MGSEIEPVTSTNLHARLPDPFHSTTRVGGFTDGAAYQARMRRARRLRSETAHRTPRRFGGWTGSKTKFVEGFSKLPATFPPKVIGARRLNPFGPYHPKNT